jgi:3-phenylpropionate/trans-cinnamate dioxygenase ferredoxin component
VNEYDAAQGEPIQAIAAQLDELVRAFEAHPDPRVRHDAFLLLNRVDALHRAALAALIAGLRAAGAGAALARATADPVVRLLFELYGFLPGADPAPVELALDQVRPSLEAAGAAVQLLGVQETAVRLRITGPAATGLGEGPSPRDLVEAVLREHFPALGRIEVEDTTARPPASFIPLAAIAVPRPPPALTWHAVGTAGALSAGGTERVVVAGRWLVLCNVAGELHAVRDACPGGMMPLAAGELIGAELHCPWHGCRFDVRTGRRTAGHGADVETFPVRIADGTVEVGILDDVSAGAAGQASGR